jgi:hypothetical protein
MGADLTSAPIFDAVEKPQLNDATLKAWESWFATGLNTCFPFHRR